ncbi:hypothetical protein BPO_0261 [Bergeyella porcorum]|uniref:Uncharacterized protein n=1 Tax=Bergeyella porcorum TaxID=1735111 RepID=A0AAU0F0I1_9FLAO
MEVSKITVRKFPNGDKTSEYPAGIFLCSESLAGVPLMSFQAAGRFRKFPQVSFFAARALREFRRCLSERREGFGGFRKGFTESFATFCVLSG